MRKCRANCCSLNRQCVENGTGMSPNVGFGGPEARLEREWHKTA
ncbi:MAG TPA: hypothetical protein VLM75_03435 [Spirochaetota bacterium]|nr:hypothetical protein [Spirochaetota bacterium]